MRLPTIHPTTSLPIIVSFFALSLAVFSTAVHLYRDYEYRKSVAYQQELQIQQLSTNLSDLSLKLNELESEDQLVINKKLKADIVATNKVFDKVKIAYEKMVDAKIQLKNNTYDKDFALIINYLSDLNYASAEAKLVKLDTDISVALTQLHALKGIDVTSLTLAKEPPSSGYRRQKVTVEGREYVVDIVTGDLGNTRVIVDTASNETCGNECPVLSVADYAARNGAWAAINGSYFCPASYPSCAGKTNSFDLLVMNKNKVYLNSDNNVYSTNPAVIFMGGSVRFVGNAQEWGRDTGIDSMLSNYPLLIMSGAVQFSGNDDTKMIASGNRSFVASKGNTVYIGVVHGVSVVGSAKVLHAMGMEHAINLDSGGSTALWVSGAYKVGPGRNIPNAILFTSK